jgi:hypothetical protein
MLQRKNLTRIKTGPEPLPGPVDILVALGVRQNGAARAAC